MDIKTQNEYLSSDIKVDLLKPGQIAKFRLCRAGVKDPRTVDMETGTAKIVNPRGHFLADRTVISDPGAGGSPVTLQPIVAYDPVPTKPGEKQVFQPIVEAPHFDHHGNVIVTHDQPDILIYMKLHPKNRDSPCRDPKKAPVFYEVDEIKDQALELDANNIKAQIMSMIYGANEAQVQEFANVLFQSGDKRFKVLNPAYSPDKLRNTIYNLVPKYGTDMMQYFPEDARINIEFKIHKLLNIARFRFDANERTWHVNRKVQEKGKKKLAVIEPGNDPVQGLIDYCFDGQDGAEVFRIIKEEYATCYESIKK